MIVVRGVRVSLRLILKRLRLDNVLVTVKITINNIYLIVSLRWNVHADTLSNTLLYRQVDDNNGVLCELFSVSNLQYIQYYIFRRDIRSCLFVCYKPRLCRSRSERREVRIRRFLGPSDCRRDKLRSWDGRATGTLTYAGISCPQIITTV